MKERKVLYQVFISLLDEASTRGPAFEKKKSRKKTVEVGLVQTTRVIEYEREHEQAFLKTYN